MLAIWVAFIASTNLTSLLEYSLQVSVEDRFAQSTVHAVLVNPSPCAELVTFTLQIPLSARLSGVTLTSANCSSTSAVRASAEARAAFNDAASRGLQAGLIRAFDISSLDLSVSVPALATVHLAVTYAAVVTLRGGRIVVDLPLVAPMPCDRLDAQVAITEAEGIAELRCEAAEGYSASELQLTSRLTGARTGWASAHASATAARRAGGYTARVRCSYAPLSLPEQGLMLYDDAPSADGFAYALYLLRPPSFSVSLPRAIHFAVDVSGSMSGAKLEDAKAVPLRTARIPPRLTWHTAQIPPSLTCTWHTARIPPRLTCMALDCSGGSLWQALLQMLEGLHAADGLSIATFASSAPEATRTWAAASPAAIAEAAAFVRGLTAAGGTNLDGACMHGIGALQRTRTRAEQVPVLVLLTDGQPSAGVTRPELIRAHLLAANAALRAPV